MPSNNHSIQEEDAKALREALNGLTPFEAADLIANRSLEEQFFLFNSLSPELVLQTFDFLPVHVQRNLLHIMPKEKAATLLRELSPDDRTNFLQDLPQQIIDELIKLLPLEERAQTRTLLGYPEGSVGRLMTPDYIAVKMNWTIGRVLDYVQAYGHDSETIDVFMSLIIKVNS